MTRVILDVAALQKPTCAGDTLWHHYDCKTAKGTTIMAIDTSKGHPDMDYAEHMGTYNGFLRLVQVTIVFLVALLIGMYVFLV